MGNAFNQLRKHRRTQRRIRNHQAAHQGHPGTSGESLVVRIGDIVKRENINPNPRCVSPLRKRIVHDRARVNDFRKRIYPAPVAISGKFVALDDFRGIKAFSDKTLVIIARHYDVHVVIPGDKTLMPRRAKAAAVSEEVRKPFFSANAIYLVHDFELDAFHIVNGDFLHRCSFWLAHENEPQMSQNPAVAYSTAIGVNYIPRNSLGSSSTKTTQNPTPKNGERQVGESQIQRYPAIANPRFSHADQRGPLQNQGPSAHDSFSAREEASPYTKDRTRSSNRFRHHGAQDSCPPRIRTEPSAKVWMPQTGDPADTPLQRTNRHRRYRMPNGPTARTI